MSMTFYNRQKSRLQLLCCSGGLPDIPHQSNSPWILKTQDTWGPNHSVRGDRDVVTFFLRPITTAICSFQTVGVFWDRRRQGCGNHSKVTTLKQSSRVDHWWQKGGVEIVVCFFGKGDAR